MKSIVLVVLATILFAGITVAQPQDGDLIVSRRNGPVDSSGILVYSMSSGKWKTLFQNQSLFASALNKPRMAKNNRDLMAGHTVSPGWHMVSVNGKTGIGTTLSTVTGAYFTDYELDYDGTWIVTGFTFQGSRHLWSFRAASNSLTTLYSLPKYGGLVGVAIDREPTTLHKKTPPPYVLGFMGTGGPLLVHADRQGIIRTLVPASVPNTTPMCLDLDPLTGDYLTCFSPNLISLISRNQGLITTLSTQIGYVRDAHIAQDGTIWFAENVSNSTTLRRVVHFDRVKRAVTRTIVVPIPNPMNVPGIQLLGLELYGSRKLVCNGTGKAGTAVQIKISSRRSGDANQQYALACSLNRRPPGSRSCWRFPHGEYLFLDNSSSDPLFLLTAQDLVPSIFRNFRGVLDNQGTNILPIQVDIPANLPSNLGITVFVAGVIYSTQRGVHTVTNTHWFVLN